MKYRYLALPALSVFCLTLPRAHAQGEPPAVPAPGEAAEMPASLARTVIPPVSRTAPPELQSFEFTDADLDTVMAVYCEWTGQIYLKNNTVSASISLKADKVTVPECIDLVETILAMNNIALVPYGEKFIKVVPTGQVVGESDPTNFDEGATLTPSHKFVTQLIQLQNVQIPEIQGAIQHLMNPQGKIQTLEGSNSLLITDTEANILRIRELVDFVDKASARIEPRIYEIVYADATEIAAKLNEIVAMAQADQKNGSTARTTRNAPPGVIRARSAQPRNTVQTSAAISSTESGNRSVIQGTVKIMADERTNLIMIFSQAENFDFFTDIIKVLDVEVEPAITFEVINLEYADAEELSSTLNELVGAAQEGASTPRGRTGTAAPSLAVQNAVIRANATGDSSAGNLSKLSENTKILADQRSNSILLMGRKSDIAAIKNVIASLDIRLEQVLIEAAIFEVTLGDDLRHGVDWLYRGENGEKLGAWDGQNLLNNTNGVATVAASALSYYQNLTGINTEIAINLAASDSNVRLLSTPVVMTTDNTEARLSVGERRPVVTSTSTYNNSAGTTSSNYEYKDIGIQLTVTPRINPQRVVVMEILQAADQVGDEIQIDGNDVPVILNREFEAQISVPDRGTIALGGLINTETRDSVSKIPVLGDIPLLGRYLFSSTSKENRQTELVVLLTPYVLTNNDEVVKETERLYDSTDMVPSDWPRKGWSESTLQQREKENAPSAP